MMEGKMVCGVHSDWSREEDKISERALAVYDRETPHRSSCDIRKSKLLRLSPFGSWFYLTVHNRMLMKSETLA